MCHHSICSAIADGISRRTFLQAAGTTAVGGFLLRETSAAETQQVDEADSPDQWPEIRVAYLRPKQEYWLGWPGTAWDIQGYMDKSRRQVEQFARELQVRLTFEPEPLYDQPAVDRLLADLQSHPPQGILLLPLHMDRWPMIQQIAAAGVPTIIFAPLGVCFTGHIQALSKQPGVYLASSADFELNPVRYGIKMIRTAHDVRRTRIAVIAGEQRVDQVLDPFGLNIRRLPRKLFPEVLETIQESPEVMAIVKAYEQAAFKQIEPSRADLINAARNYVASKKILEQEGCQGISMDCLGLVTDRQIPCPPCMAWSKFLDAGIPAICEADVNAVMSLTLCCKLLDKPGFMQDPVPETVNNTLIGAHCVCPTRIHGYEQPAERFILRSHSESDLGVSLQVLWPEGQEVTVMQFMGPGKMILGRGEVLRNHNTPPAGGCRTSVELSLDGPADTRDTQGFHQLFITGNHVRDFQAYGQMYGIATEHI